ncbi:hypothetical protein [Catenovulum adriaticum]|uniref:Lipoprotein n=1 Tax=Catenovulum adriaticum TaxID=2984846 RepID=A0ABY7AQV0_9ALTE|nr:hypothetical protein [Catenovulum sp. TS8]WAJ71930.1 hypothetical protein OLW01_14485 [Catenovulum sp. TS8]
MKIQLVFTFLLCLSGCTLLPMSAACLDAKIPKKSLEDDQAFHVFYTNTKTGVVTERTILCEQFYNAQCSARGNYWDWRHAAKPDKYNLTLNDGRAVSLNAPLCTDLVNKDRTGLNYTYLNFNEVDGIWLVKNEDKWIYKQYDKVTKTSKLVFEVPVTIKIEKR